MDPSHMHHHRPPSTVSLKFAETKKIKEEEESEMEEEEAEEGFEDELETDEEEDIEQGEEVKEEVEGIQLKKKRMDLLDGLSWGKRSKAAAVAGGNGGCGGDHDGGFAAEPRASCKVEKCNADLSDCKRYHKRHRVCELHAKAQVAIVEGLKQRFCQQCSRFHELPEFDDTKRSCRRRLEGHNARRRKSFTESRAEGSGRRGSKTAGKKDQCRQVEEIGRSQIDFPKNHRNLHIH